MDGNAARTSRADVRRQAILDIAREVFLKEGYAAASMSAIAARVGGSKATLYTYFPSKEGLFAEIIVSECRAAAAPVLDEMRRGGDIADVLKRSGCRFVRFLTSDKVLALHRLVIAESVRFPELGRAFYDAGPQTGLRLASEFLREAMVRGQLRAADPEVAAEQFIHLCKAGLYQKRLWNLIPEPSDAQIEANVERAMEMFMAAYGPCRA
jgi:AcrR family transcriptional regulator